MSARVMVCSPGAGKPNKKIVLRFLLVLTFYKRTSEVPLRMVSKSSYFSAKQHAEVLAFAAAHKRLQEK